MKLDLAFDRTSPLPLHLQIQTSIENNIARGILPPGAKLPTVADFARAYSFSSHTVMRAYSELIRKGVLTAKRGHGTFVCEKRQATTIVLLPVDDPEKPGSNYGISVELRDFCSGVHLVHASASRRISTLSLGGGEVKPRELLDICKVQHADSLVMYAVKVADDGGMPMLAEQMATVAVDCGILRDKPLFDCVNFSNAGALRELLRQRLREGVRKFAYIGVKAMLKDEYLHLFEVFHETIGAAGITPANHLIEPGSTSGRDAAIAAIGARLAKDTLVFGMTPAVVNVLLPHAVEFELVSMTKSSASLDKFKGAATLVYSSLNNAGREAGRLLKERLETTAHIPPRQCLLNAEIMYRTPKA